MEIPFATVNPNPPEVKIDAPLLTLMVAFREENVNRATPVDGVDCFLINPKLLPSLSRSVPIDSLSDCLFDTPCNSSYRRDNCDDGPSINRSLATVPGLVSKFG